MPQLENPYHDIEEPEDIRVSKAWAWIGILLFLAVCVIPPLWRNVDAAIYAATADRSSRDFDIDRAWVPVTEIWRDQTARKSDPGFDIVAHLRAFESKVEKGSFTEPPRRWIQSGLVKVFGEGNTKALVGRSGWLFFRPGVGAVTGYGPVAEAPVSVASDPKQKNWRPALPAIERFAAELSERGIELILVPVPVKPMIYPEYVGWASANATAPVTHADAQAFHDRLRTSGITVVDLTDAMIARKRAGEDVFLRQDTHWQPAAMAMAAEVVAEDLKTRPWFAAAAASAEPLAPELQTLSRSFIGDLVKHLDLPESISIFQPESVELTRVVDPESGERIKPNPNSPITVLGDSFVNIFDDASIGFGDERAEDGELIGAGFAQRLAAELGMPLDVIAVNGKASTQVREDFAHRPDNVVRAKKAVVWVIASRDLFYTARLAQANNVEWGDVTWSTAIGEIDSGDGESFEILATLRDKAPLPDPSSTPYTNALYESEWTAAAAPEGAALPESFDPDGFRVILWGFRERRMMPESALEPGTRYRLRLVPFLSREELTKLEVARLEEFSFTEPFFAVETAPAQD